MKDLDQFISLATIAPLLFRMGLVAFFVIAVAVIAERLGPFLGGMVASLPLLTGPVYVLLALEHDAAYFHATTVASVAICSAIPVFVLVYAMLAPSQSGPVSVLGALLAWSVLGVIVSSREWSLPEALLFVAPVYAVSLPLAQNFTRGVAVRRAKRHWSDLVVRAVLVAGFTGVIMVVSKHVPASVTGVLSVMPILMSSLMLVLHARIGGLGTAALMAHTLGGIVGMVLAFSLVHLTVLSIGVWPALASGLALSVGWNTMLIIVKRLRSR
ncbi:MAG: hypothetical protein R3D67_00665 [Hyphomicrobiaceae bacterium]